jgi:hypothetical protein
MSDFTAVVLTFVVVSPSVVVLVVLMARGVRRLWCSDECV